MTNKKEATNKRLIQRNMGIFAQHHQHQQPRQYHTHSKVKLRPSKTHHNLEKHDTSSQVLKTLYNGVLQLSEEDYVHNYALIKTPVHISIKSMDPTTFQTVNIP
jgi:hypothetical protein